MTGGSQTVRDKAPESPPSDVPQVDNSFKPASTGGSAAPQGGNGHPPAGSASMGHMASAPPDHHVRFPNPRETTIPDPVTLGEQWAYARRMYSRHYARAWGLAITAGAAAYGIGYIVKGGNPLVDDDSRREVAGGNAEGSNSKEEASSAAGGKAPR
eukprot:jgi/Mesen1/10152/ME000076S09662